MFFYICFTAFLYLSAWRRSFELLFGFAVLIAIVDRLHLGFVPLEVWGRPITLEFVFGCMIAADYLGGGMARMTFVASLIVLALGVGLLIAGGLHDDLLQGRWYFRGLPSALIVYSVVAIEREYLFKNYVLHKLGDATYSIYLTHIFVVMGVEKLWLAARLSTGNGAAYLFVAICLLAATVTGMIAYELVEIRLNRWAKRLLLAGNGRLND
jgi:peptidoglycan/LPS O-acetylase OafA/YrhL